jgi:hypothetical protein
VVFDGQQRLRLDALRHGRVKVGLPQQVLAVAVLVELMLQNFACPSEAGGGTQAKLALKVVFAARHEEQVFSPTDFSNQRLEFWPASALPNAQCSMFLIDLLTVMDFLIKIHLH